MSIVVWVALIVGAGVYLATNTHRRVEIWHDGTRQLASISIFVGGFRIWSRMYFLQGITLWYAVNSGRMAMWASDVIENEERRRAIQTHLLEDE